jgi:hypothetical protein
MKNLGFAILKSCILGDETPTSPERDVSGQAGTGTPLSAI